MSSWVSLDKQSVEFVCDRDLFDIVTEEDKVDAAEAQLGDDQKQVHRVSERERETKGKHA